ncbi:anhydro-N-acetylmuramic acid kinase [Oligella urethralis]|uniref:Anhydro-N-acetylmuramic acid kinase n=1 Tax=Oligella urethralis TaxID=90245 RepID=A0A2X1USY4_9BURK|nr:anhydro-N-acetylmuramic acid kinase [Oligella urethralis]SPY07551.1 Anhydro-N-acetylmuramic acid kinase [Oligella urethralis]
MNRQSSYFIGIMSGTSTDGVDASLIRIEPTAEQTVQLINTSSIDIPLSLREIILRLNQSGLDELRIAAEVSLELARLYAEVTQTILLENGLVAEEINALGIHGQTVRHRPEHGYSIQLNAPALVAELTGIDVIADFRSRDIAAGGQGAPLIPAFHHAIFHDKHKARALLNIGGISNLSLLHPAQATTGFDCGPGNMLLDYWCQKHLGQRFDKDGRWAAQGEINQAMLSFFLSSEAWLQAAPPKSTGRDLFNGTWLEQKLATFFELNPTVHSYKAEDIQATLTAFTVSCIVDSLTRYASDTEELIVFGGGAANPEIMRQLARALPYTVLRSDALGIATQAMESTAFAWLAWAFRERLPVCTPEMTGARHASVAGSLYPA